MLYRFQETVATDFVQVNHAYDGLAYQWAYAVEHPFSAGNSIAKINVGEPSGFTAAIFTDWV